MDDANIMRLAEKMRRGEQLTPEETNAMISQAQANMQQQMQALRGGMGRGGFSRPPMGNLPGIPQGASPFGVGLQVPPGGGFPQRQPSPNRFSSSLGQQQPPGFIPNHAPPPVVDSGTFSQQNFTVSGGAFSAGNNRFGVNRRPPIGADHPTSPEEDAFDPLKPQAKPGVELLSRNGEIQSDSDYEQFLKKVRDASLATLPNISTADSPQQGAEMLKALQEEMDRKPASYQSAMGCLMQMAPEKATLVGSVYLLASAALQERTSVTHANSLGVALLNSAEAECAFQLLKYANETLIPKGKTSAPVLTNLGYTAMTLGDLIAAQHYFQSALATAGALDASVVGSSGHIGANDLAAAHMGLALLANSRGDRTTVFQHIQSSASIGHSETAMTLNSQIACEEDAKTSASDDGDANEGRKAIAENPGTYIALGVGLVIDMNAPELDYPIWTPPAEAKAAAAALGPWGEWVAKNQHRVQQLQQQQHQALQAQSMAMAAMIKRKAEMAAEKGEKFIPIVNMKVIFLLEDLLMAVRARVQRVWNHFKKRQEQLIKETKDLEADMMPQYIEAMKGATSENAQKRIRHQFAVKMYAIAQSSHGGWGALYSQTFPKIKQILQKYYRDSSPYIECLAIPEMQEWQALSRKHFIVSCLVNHRSELPVWAFVMKEMTALDPDYFQDPGPDPEEVKKEEKIPDPNKANNFKNWPPAGKFKIGPFGIEYDHTGFTIGLKGQMGLMAGVSVKFSSYTQSHERETTVFAGIGASGSLGPVDGSAKGVVSFTQAHGQVVDVKAGFSTNADVDLPMDLGGLHMKSNVEWSMLAGPDSGFKAQGSLIGVGAFKVGY